MKSIINSLMICLTIIAAFTDVEAQTGKFNDAITYNLQSCIEFAIENNPNLKSVALQELGNDYKIKEVKSALYPTVNGSGQYVNNYALAEQLLPGEILGQPGTTIPVQFGVANMITGQVELQQVIYNKGLKSGIRAAEASKDLMKLQTFSTKEELVYNIAQSYLQINLTEKQAGILSANLSRITKLMAIAQIQFEEGLAKKVDVSQLKVNRTNLETEFKNLEIGLNQQKNYLKFLMGLQPNQPLNIEPLNLEEASYPLVNDLILDQNTTLQLLNKQIEMTVFEEEGIVAGYYPSVAAFANFGWQGQTDKLFSNEDKYDIQGATTGVVGVRLNVPIFDGFQRKHQLEQLRVRQSQYQLDRNYLKNSIALEFANANETLTQNKSVLEMQDLNMELAEELYEVAKLSYQEGVAPLTELLNAETSLKEAQTQYITALLNLKLAELDHLKSSGQLAKLIKDGK